MSIDDAIQSHYNQKVADYELNGGSRYDLAETYLKDAKKWSILSTIGPLPFSLLTNASLYFVLSYDQSKLNKLKLDNPDSNIKNYDLELYKKYDKYITRPLSIVALGFTLIADYVICSKLSSADSYQESLYWVSGIFGLAFDVLSLVKRFQYSYIINADPTAKKKTFKFKEKFYELQDTIGKILNDPTPTMIKGN